MLGFGGFALDYSVFEQSQLLIYEPHVEILIIHVQIVILLELHFILFLLVFFDQIDSYF